MPESQVTVFVDTCIFLHFKPFTQIKWRDKAKAERVTLAVCLQVIDDLDKFSHDARLGERARRSLKEIEENENTEFQPGVSLVITPGLNRQDFPPEMDPEHTDNQVIRSAQVYQQHPQATTRIVPNSAPTTRETEHFGHSRQHTIDCITFIHPSKNRRRTGRATGFLRNEEQPRATVTLGELIHKNTPTKLLTIIFWFPNNERLRTFGASYSAICAELPRSLEKHLLFEIAGA